MNVGDRVKHYNYGEGIISRKSLTTYEIFFETRGKMQFSTSNADLEYIESLCESKGEQSVNLKQIEEAITYVLDKYGALQAKVELGGKWIGGTMILKPQNNDHQSKEVPIENFFHKIVMLRDRLRVLEQNINSHAILTDEDKVNLQQYITRIYGSLTTFNILFADKDDYFVGQKGS